MAKGAAMSGIIQTVGEHVCGMDHVSAEFFGAGQRDCEGEKVGCQE
jgi:hypothetical protein